MAMYFIGAFILGFLLMSFVLRHLIVKGLKTEYFGGADLKKKI